MHTRSQPVSDIKNWKQFTQLVRSKGCYLLKNLGNFPDAILVSGCQRSGTTILSRIITQSKEMEKYWFGPDDELDAALILSGYAEHQPSHQRYCFQTTYLDECYQEYYDHKGNFKLIWVIRNPYSVAFSLMYNWAPGALDGTFGKTATHLLSGYEQMAYKFLGTKCFSKVYKASLIYKAKTLQLIELFRNFEPSYLFVVDYDEMVLNKDAIFSKIYEFVNLEYDPSYTEQLHHQSINKKNQLSRREIKIVEKIANPYYEKAQKLLSTSYKLQ